MVVILFNRRSTSLKRLFITIERSANKHVLELHDVSSERARLVREDIVDLAELFDETCCLRGHEYLALRRVTKCIHLNKLRLDDLDNFQADLQRDGQHCIQQQEVREERKRAQY